MEPTEARAEDKLEASVDTRAATLQLLNPLSPQAIRSQSPFLSLLTTNYSLISHPVTCNLASNVHSPISKITATRYPYQLVFSLVQNVQIPRSELTECYLRISLFDLELNKFFGKSWQSTCIWRSSTKKESDQDSLDQVAGGRLNVRLKNQCAYFHTSISSTHIVAVVEFVFQSNPQMQVSGGWTLIPLFNPQKGGLNLDRIWSDEEQDDDDESKTVPVFTGTPRILPFISGLFVAPNAPAYPALQMIPNASLRYHLIVRPDIHAATYLWKQNVFIGPGTDVPGIKSISIKGIETLPAETATLSNLAFTVKPSVNSFEDVLLDRITYLYLEANPGSMTPDAYGNLVAPVILERRVHIGFHNTYTFLEPPVIVTIHPSSTDASAASQLVFHGNLKIDKYSRNVPNVELLFMVEYKIQLTVNAPADEKKHGIVNSIIQKISPTAPDLPGLQQVDRFVCVGWGSWKATDGDDLKKVTLQYGSRPNPFAAFVYTVTGDLYSEYSHDLEMLGKEVFMDAEFYFNSSGPKLQPISPVQVAPVEQVEQSMPVVERKHKDTNELEYDQDMVESVGDLETSIINLPSPKPSTLKSRLTRVERARLLNAGFEKILDQDGNKPTPIYLNDADTSSLTSDLDIELKDTLANDVTLSFLGVSFNETLLSRMAGKYPDSVYFSFQFYNFPYFTTERAKVYTGELPPAYEKHSAHHARSSSVPQNHMRAWSHLSHRSFASTAGQQPDNQSEDAAWPGILYRFEKDGRPACIQSNKDDRPPGISNQFYVDPLQEINSDTVRYGKCAFPYYMAQRQLYIDVWDGNSLLHIGTACVDLRTALRQGRAGVTVDEDVDIILHQVT